MNELILALNAAGVRYLLIGGQAMRLAGMPRYSMDWDFFIPPRDEANFSKLNELLKDELDVPVVARGEFHPDLSDEPGGAAIPPRAARCAAL